MSLAHDVKNTARTRDVQIVENITFNSMLLSELTLSGLEKSGFHKPSPIQLHGIPLGKCGFDLLLEAKSGTGKTAVFSIIALEKIDLNNGLQVMILTPTREIAAQICDVIKLLGSEYRGLNVEVVMGGLSVNEDIAKFKKQVHIVVGSPGRVKHLILGNHMNLSTVRLFILDECDKLMEKAFLSDINYIFSTLPDQKQVIMSSATYPKSHNEIIYKFVKNAQHICPDSTNILIGITQKVTLVKNNSNIVKQTQNRFEQLILILSKIQFKQCLIFCNYQARVTELYRLLNKSKWPVSLLYGQQEQLDRLCALKKLQDYKCRILISTDLAARGIDGSNIDLVINFEPPFEWQTYLHRIGRAGRFGSYGTAITILSEGKESRNFQNMLNYLTPSFNLTDLWTEEIFNLEKQVHKEDCDLHIQDPERKECKEVLWGLLTRDKESLSQMPCISDGNLNGSQVNSKECEIETFTNLVTSFQNDHTLNTEFSYGIVSVKELPFKEQINPTSNLRTLNTSFTSTERAKDNEIKDEKVKSSKQVLNVPSSHKQNIFNDLCIPKDHIYKEEPDRTILDEENKQKSVEKAMLEAGLPLCFGKPKWKKSEKWQHKHSYKIRDRNEDIHQNKCKNEIKTKSLLHEDINNTSVHNNSIIECSSKIVNKNDLNLCKGIYEKTKLRIPVFYDSGMMSTNCKDSYDAWYKILKNYMRHIEYLAYIDELSRV